MSAADFQRDLGRYWRHARKLGGVTLTQQGWVYKSVFKSFLTALNRSDALSQVEDTRKGERSTADEQRNGELWFMRRLLTAMHEFTGDSFDHELKVNPNGKLLGMPMAQRVKWTFETWRDSGAWNELLRLPVPSSGADPRRESPPALGKARLALLRAMSRLASGQPSEWVSPLNLITYVKRHDYQFLFERRHRSQYGGLYTSPYYGPNNPYGITFTHVKDESSGWNMVEHGFIVNVLTGPLHWMGLVELSYDPTPKPSSLGEGRRGGVENTLPSAYRLTDAGAWLLGVGEQPKFVESGGKVIVQPNFTVLALEPISDAVLNDLDHFAESQGGERAMSYQLTRESLYGGQQSGWNAARVIEFLEAHQGAPIPTNVRRSLEEWEASHRRITFHRNRCVVQFADAEAQSESADALAVMTPRSLGAHFELIEGHDASEVISALRAAGWMPTLQAAGEQAAESVLRINEDGRVAFTQAAPSVYALGRLAQLVDPTPSSSPSGEGREGGAGGGVITASSVRAAMSQGMLVDQLLATLAELHVGPIPVAFEAKIRAWASFFGNASLREIVLLELDNLEVLSNLIQDPQVGPHLTPIEGSSAPLAIVEASHADEVRRLLGERGINVS